MINEISKFGIIPIINISKAVFLLGQDKQFSVNLVVHASLILSPPQLAYSKIKNCPIKAKIISNNINTNTGNHFYFMNFLNVIIFFVVTKKQLNRL